jgi:hypothetical protein
MVIAEIAKERDNLCYLITALDARTHTDIERLEKVIKIKSSNRLCSSHYNAMVKIKNFHFFGEKKSKQKK